MVIIFGLLWLVLLAIAVIAWIPRIGPAVLKRIRWTHLPVVGRLTGFAASGVLLVGSCASLVAGAAVAPPSTATPAPRASVAAHSTQISPPPVSTSAPTTPAPAATVAVATPSPSPVTCQMRGALPDPVCTPGATDPRVTQATIGSTICVSGYTATVRPPSTYTNALKIDQMKAYGLTTLTPADVEEDHLIALELGGDPRDPRNLWPEPRGTTPGAREKDTLENRLHADVCAGRLALADAQRMIATDWVAAVAPSSAPSTPTPTAAPAVTDAPTQAPAATATEAPAATLTVTITASRYGLVAAVTSAGASCTAKARLPSGNYSTAAGLANAMTADGNGAVSWSYRTSTTTKPGTGTHTVTCSLNGQTASSAATFTVP